MEGFHEFEMRSLGTTGAERTFISFSFESAEQPIFRQGFNIKQVNGEHLL
jgi:hypothetical protein